MKLVTAAMLALILISAGSPGASLAESDQRAVDIAHATMQAMGGSDAMSSVRVLRFDWAVERDGETLRLYSHWWDRYTGDYRVDGETSEGASIRALFNINTRQGDVWVAGQQLEGEALEERLEWAYGRFINDSYWLLMPWKWLDPGVVLTWDGEEEVEGRSYDVVRLEFGSEIGLTSNDQYRAWVSRETGLMERWGYVLQDDEGKRTEGEPTLWDWVEWTETPAGLLFARSKRRVGGEGDVAITAPRVEVWSSPSADELTEAFRPDQE